ncbi:M20/M25/M40 family metallo-hydrolase, partial [Myxococcota bacterium]|nr:M20/M25/M40 family metallo-hydrolase [Myxococcota bacterium]
VDLRDLHHPEKGDRNRVVSSCFRSVAYAGRLISRTPSAISSLAVLLFTVFAVTPAQAAWPFDELFPRPSVSQRAADILSEAIRMQTVNPPGREQALAYRLAEILSREGIESDVISTPNPNGGKPRAAVWGRLRGQGDRPGLALLSHLDTVPADASEWSVPPFSGRIADGYVWGRGALDAKGVAVTHLMTLIELASSNQRLERDLLFIATPDEETGGRNGAGWIVANHPEILEGIGYLLTEGGGIQQAATDETSHPPIWGVALTEKTPCWLELRAHGRGGHSSAPTSEDAVPRLVAALDKIRRAESPVRVLSEVEQMFAALAPIAPEWDRAAYLNLAGTLERDEGFRRRFLDNPGQNALVRNTISITLLQGGPATNVAPSVARAQLDARLLPGRTCAEFAAAIGALIDDATIEIEEILSFSSRASSADTPLFRAIEAVSARQDPKGLVVPRLIGGFTDAHWFREMGIVAYGFVPRTLTSEEAEGVHGVDERIAVDALTKGIGLQIDLVRAFDAIESAEHRKQTDVAD